MTEHTTPVPLKPTILSPIPNLEAPTSPYRAHLEQIDRSSPSGLIKLNNLATEIFINDPQYAQDRDVLGSSEDDRLKVTQTLQTHDFPAGLSTDTHRKLFQVVSKKEELARQLILRELVKEGVAFGLKPYEVDVLKATCEIAGSYDELGMKWRNTVEGVDPDGIGNTHAAELGLTNPYTVIVGTDETGFKEIPWIERFPEVIEISNHWEELAKKLQTVRKDDPEAQKMATYFAAYATALRSTDPKEQAIEKWRDVDRSWMRIDAESAAIHPVGSREYGYYDPNGIRVFPDMRLMIRVESVGGEVRATRDALRKYMKTRFGSFHVFQATENALQTVQMFPGADVVLSGSLDFAPAGQNLPNDEVVGHEMGTKVFVNPDTSLIRWESSRATARNVFSKDTNLIDGVDPIKNGVSVRLAGHEYGEPLFQTEKAKEVLGSEDLTLHNEDLADGSVGSIIRARVADGELTQQDALNHAVNHLSIYMRHVKAIRGQSEVRPYYVGQTLQGLRRMLSSGFIAKDPDGAWRIKAENLDKYFDMVEDDFKQQVQIHEDAHNAHTDEEKKSAQQASRAYLDQAQETDEIKELIRIVNPNAVV